jgi:hypothetical protein
MVTIVLTKSTSPFRISAKRRSIGEAEGAIRKFFKSIDRYDAQVIVKSRYQYPQQKRVVIF